MTAVWTEIISLTELGLEEMKPFQHDGRRLAVFRLADGRVSVTDNVCTHEFALLTDGWLEGCEIECPLHAGRFDVVSGKGLCAPIKKDLTVYPCEIREDTVYALLPSGA
ncbi:Rieske 2Fe-2S domain-containing protein [bacterium]|nr:Rieske 2Fe-2S domain-containing protein [bacterium]